MSITNSLTPEQLLRRYTEIRVKCNDKFTFAEAIQHDSPELPLTVIDMLYGLLSGTINKDVIEFNSMDRWPETFITGDITGKTTCELLSDVLMAIGTAHMLTPPPKFGEALVTITNAVGIGLDNLGDNPLDAIFKRCKALVELLIAEDRTNEMPNVTLLTEGKLSVQADKGLVNDANVDIGLINPNNIVIKPIRNDVYQSWLTMALLSLTELTRLSGEKDDILNVRDTLNKYIDLLIADACKTGYHVLIKFKDNETPRLATVNNHWKVIANHNFIESFKVSEPCAKVSDSGDLNV